MLEKICGMRVKNTYKGPAALLAEVEDEQGNQNIALVFQEEYHEHPLLNDSLSNKLKSVALLDDLQISRGCKPDFRPFKPL